MIFFKRLDINESTWMMKDHNYLDKSMYTTPYKYLMYTYSVHNNLSKWGKRQRLIKWNDSITIFYVAKSDIHVLVIQSWSRVTAQQSGF